jgi:signal transduction histidine kinase
VTRALDDIEGACRRTVGEMDAVLGGLRGEVDLPGLAGLDDLISGHRRLGRQVDATIDYNGVDARTGRAAYRIVQEALTNALRHAPDDPVELTVVQTEDSLDIQVANATAVDMFREGRGLTGMKERAADLGGSADAKAREGRFTLTARLPADAPS